MPFPPASLHAGSQVMHGDRKHSCADWGLPAACSDSCSLLSESQHRVTAVARELTWRRRWQRRRQPHKEEPVLPATTLHQVIELQHSATDPRLSLLAHPAPRPCLGRSNPGCAHTAGTARATTAAWHAEGAAPPPPALQRSTCRRCRPAPPQAPWRTTACPSLTSQTPRPSTWETIGRRWQRFPTLCWWWRGWSCPFTARWALLIAGGAARV